MPTGFSTMSGTSRRVFGNGGTATANASGGSGTRYSANGGTATANASGGSNNRINIPGVDQGRSTNTGGVSDPLAQWRTSMNTWQSQMDDFRNGLSALKQNPAPGSNQGQQVSRYVQTQRPQRPAKPPMQGQQPGQFPMSYQDYLKMVQQNPNGFPGQGQNPLQNPGNGQGMPPMGAPGGPGPQPTNPVIQQAMGQQGGMGGQPFAPMPPGVPSIQPFGPGQTNQWGIPNNLWARIQPYLNRGQPGFNQFASESAAY